MAEIVSSVVIAGGTNPGFITNMYTNESLQGECTAAVKRQKRVTSIFIIIQESSFCVFRRLWTQINRSWLNIDIRREIKHLSFRIRKKYSKIKTI